MWVVFNEGWGQFDTARITEWTKELDPTRLVDCASGWNDLAGVGDVHDIHVYPGPAARRPSRSGRPCSASSAAWAWASTATPGPRRPGAIAGPRARTT